MSRGRRACARRPLLFGSAAPSNGAAGHLSPAYLAFARFAAAKSQLTSLSKNVCAYTGRRFW